MQHVERNNTLDAVPQVPQFIIGDGTLGNTLIELLRNPVEKRSTTTTTQDDMEIEPPRAGKHDFSDSDQYHATPRKDRARAAAASQGLSSVDSETSHQLLTCLQSLEEEWLRAILCVDPHPSVEDVPLLATLSIPSRDGSNSGADLSSSLAHLTSNEVACGVQNLTESKNAFDGKQRWQESNFLRALTADEVGMGLRSWSSVLLQHTALQGVLGKLHYGTQTLKGGNGNNDNEALHRSLRSEDPFKRRLHGEASADEAVPPCCASLLEATSVLRGNNMERAFAELLRSSVYTAYAAPTALPHLSHDVGGTEVVRQIPSPLLLALSAQSNWKTEKEREGLTSPNDHCEDKDRSLRLVQGLVASLLGGVDEEGMHASEEKPPTVDGALPNTQNTPSQEPPYPHRLKEEWLLRVLRLALGLSQDSEKVANPYCNGPLVVGVLRRFLSQKDPLNAPRTAATPLRKGRNPQLQVRLLPAADLVLPKSVALMSVMGEDVRESAVSTPSQAQRCATAAASYNAMILEFTGPDDDDDDNNNNSNSDDSTSEDDVECQSLKATHVRLWAQLVSLSQFVHVAGSPKQIKRTSRYIANALREGRRNSHAAAVWGVTTAVEQSSDGNTPLSGDSPPPLRHTVAHQNDEGGNPLLSEAAPVTPNYRFFFSVVHDQPQEVGSNVANDLSADGDGANTMEVLYTSLEASIRAILSSLDFTSEEEKDPTEEGDVGMGTAGSSAKKTMVPFVQVQNICIPSSVSGVATAGLQSKENVEKEASQSSRAGGIAASTDAIPSAGSRAMLVRDLIFAYFSTPEGGGRWDQQATVRVPWHSPHALSYALAKVRSFSSLLAWRLMLLEWGYFGEGAYATSTLSACPTAMVYVASNPHGSLPVYEEAALPPHLWHIQNLAASLGGDVARLLLVAVARHQQRGVRLHLWRALTPLNKMASHEEGKHCDSLAKRYVEDGIVVFPTEVIAFFENGSQEALTTRCGSGTKSPGEITSLEEILGLSAAVAEDVMDALFEPLGGVNEPQGHGLFSRRSPRSLAEPFDTHKGLSQRECLKVCFEKCFRSHVQRAGIAEELRKLTFAAARDRLRTLCRPMVHFFESDVYKNAIAVASRSVADNSKGGATDVLSRIVRYDEYTLCTVYRQLITLCAVLVQQYWLCLLLPHCGPEQIPDGCHYVGVNSGGMNLPTSSLAVCKPGSRRATQQGARRSKGSHLMATSDPKPQGGHSLQKDAAAGLESAFNSPLFHSEGEAPPPFLGCTLPYSLNTILDLVSGENRSNRDPLVRGSVPDLANEALSDLAIDEVGTEAAPGGFEESVTRFPTIQKKCMAYFSSSKGSCGEEGSATGKEAWESCHASNSPTEGTTTHWQESVLLKKVDECKRVVFADLLAWWILPHFMALVQASPLRLSETLSIPSSGPAHPVLTTEDDVSFPVHLSPLCGGDVKFKHLVSFVASQSQPCSSISVEETVCLGGPCSQGTFSASPEHDINETLHDQSSEVQPHALLRAKSILLQMITVCQNALRKDAASPEAVQPARHDSHPPEVSLPTAKDEKLLFMEPNFLSPTVVDLLKDPEKGTPLEASMGPGNDTVRGVLRYVLSLASGVGVALDQLTRVGRASGEGRRTPRQARVVSFGGPAGMGLPRCLSSSRGRGLAIPTTTTTAPSLEPGDLSLWQPHLCHVSLPCAIGLEGTAEGVLLPSQTYLPLCLLSRATFNASDSLSYFTRGGEEMEKKKKKEMEMIAEIERPKQNETKETDTTQKATESIEKELGKGGSPRGGGRFAASPPSLRRGPVGYVTSPRCAVAGGGGGGGGGPRQSNTCINGHNNTNETARRALGVDFDEAAAGRPLCLLAATSPAGDSVAARLALAALREKLHAANDNLLGLQEQVGGLERALAAEKMARNTTAAAESRVEWSLVPQDAVGPVQAGLLTRIRGLEEDLQHAQFRMAHWQQILTAERDTYALRLNQLHQQLALQEGLVRRSASRAALIESTAKCGNLTAEDVMKNLHEVEKMFDQVLQDRDAVKTALRDERAAFSMERTKMEAEIHRLKRSHAAMESEWGAQSRLASELRQQIDQMREDAEKQSRKLMEQIAALQSELRSANEKHTKEVEALQARSQRAAASFETLERERTEAHERQLHEFRLAQTREREEVERRQRQGEIVFERGLSDLTQQLRRAEEQIKALQGLVSAGEDQIEVLEEALQKSEKSLSGALEWQKQLMATHTTKTQQHHPPHQHKNGPTVHKEVQSDLCDQRIDKHTKAAMRTATTQTTSDNAALMRWGGSIELGLLRHATACHRLERKWYQKKLNLLFRAFLSHLAATTPPPSAVAVSQARTTRPRSDHKKRFREKKCIPSSPHDSNGAESDRESDPLGLEYEIREYRRTVASLKEALRQHEEARRIDHSTIRTLNHLLRLQSEAENGSTAWHANGNLPVGVSSWWETLSQLTPSALPVEVAPQFEAWQDLELEDFHGRQLDPPNYNSYRPGKSKDAVPPVQSAEAYRRQYVALQVEIKSLDRKL